MRFYLFLLILFNFYLQTETRSQNQNNKWFFGNQAGLDFNTSPPSSITGTMLVNEGTASIADAGGNLLFYTDGATIYNQNHQVMPNGAGINCHNNPVQPAIIIKQPGSSNLYYVFTIGISGIIGGLSYSIVDMSLSAGTGSVVTKNIVINTNTNIIEKLTATKHCNGTDFWIITKTQNSNTYYTYQLSSAGANTVPVISSIGPISSLPVSQLKISANGKKIVNTELASAFSFSLEVTLYDFDNSNGQITNPQTFSFAPTLNFPMGSYGTEFSPDCTKLYISTYYNNNNNPTNSIFQWDICSGIANSIVSTQTQVASVSGTSQIFALQLGPDNKIYVARTNQTALGVINNPNATGTACNYVHQGPSIAPNTCRMGLPNQIPNFQRPPLPPIVPAAFSQQCQTAAFVSPLSVGNTIGTCPANTYTIQSLFWNFGDPLSGAANTSTAFNPSHQFSSVGTYTVKLILDFGCGGGVDTLKQVINITNSCFVINSTSITCATLGSATVTTPPTGIAYSYTWLPVAQTGSVATGLNPGSYTLLAFDPVLNFTHSVTTTFNSLIPLSGTINNSSSVTCNGAATGTGQVLSLQGGSGNQSYLWSNGTQSYTTAITNSLTAGVWSVNVTDALTACQVNQTFFITQPPPLSPILTISTPSICAGASAILSATNSGGTPAYTYTFVNGPISFSSTITESLVGTHVYTMQSTDANNCVSSATVALNVIALPNLLVPTVSICPTAQALFIANGATSYTWLPAAAASSVTASAASTMANVTFSDNPVSNTQYTLIGSALVCTSTTTTSVFIYAAPLPIIISNSPRCEGSNAILSVSGGTGAVWSGPNIFSSSTLNTTITALGLANAGVYSTTITSAVGCTASANSTFVVNPTPAVSASGSTVCTTQTMALFANSLPGSSYQWFGANNYSSFLQNPTLPNPTLNRTGSYTVLVTAPTSCTRTAIAQVSVTSEPLPLLSFNSTSLCAQAFNGSPNTITLSPSGANSYTLYTPNLLGSSTPVVPSTSLFATAPYSSSLAAGVVTLQGSNGVCVSTNTFVFTVVPNPTVGINSYTPVICAGQNFTYTSNGAASYVWSASTPNYTTWNNGGLAVAYPSITAVFSVYGSSLGCNSALQTSTITVYPLPTLTLSAKSSSICLYDKTDISVSGTGTSFQWLPMTGLNAYTGSLVTCDTQVNQVYTVIATANNCTATATSSVHVWPLPTANIINSNSKVCLKDNIILSGSGGVSFDWKGPDKLTASGQTITLAAVSPAMAGTYTLVVSDENACKSSTTTQVDILPLPDGSLVNFKEEFCVPYCANYNFIGSNSKNIQSTWLINGTGFASNAFRYCFKEAGTFTLSGKLVDNTTGCKSNLQYVITTHEKPFADFNFLPKEPIENLDEVQFTNLSEGQGFLWYNWYFNDNKGYRSSDKNVSYLYAEPGDYRVALVAKNNWGCADTVLKTIVVAPDFALYVPNTFTPNDDNRNDVFFASVRSSKLFDLKIYDRWGAEIFHAKSPQDVWDGSFKGELCKQDTYTWVIELSTVGGDRVVKRGTVLLLR